MRKEEKEALDCARARWKISRAKIGTSRLDFVDLFSIEWCYLSAERKLINECKILYCKMNRMGLGSCLRQRRFGQKKMISMNFI